MSTKLKSALNAYGRTRLEQEVESASPHKLVCMLYDGALAYIARAKINMEQKRIADKGLAISDAISVIEQGLRPSLDIEHSGQLGENLDALYDYMTRRLLLANLHNNMDMLDEVYRLLSQLKEAWETIDNNKAIAATAQEGAEGTASERKPLSYGRI